MILDPTVPPTNKWPCHPKTMAGVYDIARRIVNGDIHPYVGANLIYWYAVEEGCHPELDGFGAAASSWESTDAHLIYDKIKMRITERAQSLLADTGE